jgi:hypothetical protein
MAIASDPKLLPWDSRCRHHRLHASMRLRHNVMALPSSDNHHRPPLPNSTVGGGGLRCLVDDADPPWDSSTLQRVAHR